MGRNLGPLNIKDSYEGLVQISGSDQLTDGSGSLISSLDIAASTATSASHAVIADSATTASNADKIDIQGTSDNLDLTIPTFDPAGGVGYNSLLANSNLNYNPSTGTLTAPNFEGTASFATTASFALNVVPIDTGSFMVTGSATDATLTFTKGDASTFDLVVDNVANATSASNAITAQTASFLPADTNLNINSITASFASFTSASIGSLRTVTGSAVIIGDEFIILNADTPTARYAGLIVYDSGSGTPATASFEWDGLSDNWIIVEESGNSGVVLTGPTGSKGSEVEPTVNTLQKGGGHHQLIDSSISDDGTLVTIDANVSASGYVSASAFIGDGSQLTGIATTPTLQDVLDNGNTATEDMTLNGVLHVGDGVSSRVINIANVGFSNTPSTDGNSFGSVIIGRDNVSGKGASISIGRNNNNRTLGNGQDNFVIGRDNGVNGNFTGANVIFGYGLQISGDGNYRAMIGGESNTSTAGSHNALLGGSSNTTSHARSAIIGGTGLATTKADEVVVKHLSIYGDTLVDDGTNTGTLLNNVGQSAVSSEDAVNTVIHLTQAEYDALTPDANTLYVIEGAETLGDTEIDGQLTGAVNTISDSGGTTALDCSVGNYFTLAMPAGGTTVLTPSNITAGQTINIKITQNASAATLTYASTIDFPGGTAFTISTGSGEVDILTLVSFDGTTLQATGLANFS